jgi:hypothetical protein
MDEVIIDPHGGKWLPGEIPFLVEALYEDEKYI